MSVTTSVLAISLKELSGRRIAPIKSADSAIFGTYLGIDLVHGVPAGDKSAHNRLRGAGQRRDFQKIKVMERIAVFKTGCLIFLFLIRFNIGERDVGEM